MSCAWDRSGTDARQRSRDDLFRAAALRVGIRSRARGRWRCPAHLACARDDAVSRRPRRVRAAGQRWGRAGIDTPLILPEDEFRRSLDAFPLEYGEIRRRTRGSSAVIRSTASRSTRRTCVVPARRRSRVTWSTCAKASSKRADDPAAIADLVAASAPAFAALLRNVARLAGSRCTAQGSDLAPKARTPRPSTGCRQPGPVARRRPARHRGPAPASFRTTSRAVEQLAHAVDTWRP